MKLRNSLYLLLCLFLLVGCATQAQLPVPLSATALTPPANRIGVAMTTLPKIDTRFPGADCLACLLTASVVNTRLTTHTQSLKHEDLVDVKGKIADLLRKKGMSAVVIDEDINLNALPEYGTKGANTALKDFSGLKTKYKVDKLLVINIVELGVRRSYAAYIPAGDPQASIIGNGYLVNLSTNTYEWYLPLSIAKAADGPWDEPPKFPGLTNAYFQVLEMAKDTLAKPFAD